MTLSGYFPHQVFYLFVLIWAFKIFFPDIYPFGSLQDDEKHLAQHPVIPTDSCRPWQICERQWQPAPGARQTVAELLG